MIEFYHLLNVRVEKIVTLLVQGMPFIVHVAQNKNLRCGIGDQDYIAAFDYLVLPWVWKVLRKKGVNEESINRLENLYENGLTIPVINGIPRKAIKDIRKSLRQGGKGSIESSLF